MCHSRCCLDVVGQPSVPSGSSFFKVMMNKDFWGFLSYSDKLSIALNVIVSGGIFLIIVPGGIFLIYQEDPERDLEYLLNASERVFNSLGHGLKWVV